MLYDNLVLHPVNIIQVVFITLTFCAYLLVWRRPRYQGFRLFLLVSGISMLSRVLLENGILHQVQLLAALGLAIGPAFYLFICDLVYAHKLKLGFQVSHFLPMIVVLGFASDIQALTILGAISQFGYTVLAVRLIRKYHVASFYSHSDAENSKLNWIYQAFAIFIAIYTLEILRQNIQQNLSVGAVYQWYLVNLLLLTAAFGFLIFYVLKRPNLFDGLEEYEDWAEQKSIEVDDAYRDDAKQLFKQIESQIRQHKCYLEDSLSLQDIVNKTDSNPRDIAWAISQGAGSNFCDFINELRVEAVKEALSNDTKLENVFALATSCGFKSQKSFNAAFKRFTGYLPKQYLKLSATR